MLVSVDELAARLDSGKLSVDTKAADALWIKFADEPPVRTVDFRTVDGNRIVHVYLNRDGALVGLEIFP